MCKSFLNIQCSKSKIVKAEIVKKVIHFKYEISSVIQISNGLGSAHLYYSFQSAGDFVRATKIVIQTQWCILSCITLDILVLWIANCVCSVVVEFAEDKHAMVQNTNVFPRPNKNFKILLCEEMLENDGCDWIQRLDRQLDFYQYNMNTYINKLSI